MVTAMTLVLTLPAIVCVVGGLVYGLAAGKASELGRLAFACGLLAFLLIAKF